MNIATRLSDKSSEEPALPSVQDRKSARLQCYALLATFDAIILALSFIGANNIISYTSSVPIGHGFVMLSAILPIYFMQATANGTYGAETLDNPYRGSIRALRSLTVAGAFVLLIAYLLKSSADFSRGVFTFGFVLSFVLIVAIRKLLHSHIMRMLAGSAHTTIVICDGVTYVRQDHEIVFEARHFGFDPATKDPRAYHRLASLIERADRLIVACKQPEAAKWAAVLRSMAVDGEILTDVQDAIGIIGMRQLGDHKTLLVQYGPMTFSARVIKRSFDIVFALSSIFLLAPILLSVALAIKAESRGPVFFRQERIGRDNKIFRIFKFRSMYHNLADTHGSKLTDIGDPRVTKVGAFLRKTSLDELPQLFNVLHGEMSIVGPRPHALAAKAADLLYWDADSRYRQRHVIKPGITGLAQVRGFRGNTHHVEDLTNRLQADLEYVADWSLRSDIAILLQTLRVVVHVNAY